MFKFESHTTTKRTMFFLRIIMVASIVLLSLLAVYSAAPQVNTPKVDVKPTLILLQQYEKHCYADSSIIYTCAPDTTNMIYTKNKLFSISGLQQKYVHKQPTYIGFKVYVDSFIKAHNR